MSLLQRLRELSVQAANDINTTKDRESINFEIQSLIKELDRIADNTLFNDKRVLSGEFMQSISMSVQVPTMQFKSTSETREQNLWAARQSGKPP